ncbi:MAG: multicopper oxidase domain-containing protein [Verrucomicrobiota bacterium]
MNLILRLTLLGAMVVSWPGTALAQRNAERDGTGNPARPFQNLWIPPVLEGKSFDLELGKSQKSFWAYAITATYCFNNARFWGPTLMLNQGDAVQIKVKNNLDEATTVHWHGLHLPPEMDGGPHQMIPPGGTWLSSFVVKNNAATYWYHPHPHEATQKQLTLGAGGLIIIRDPVEAKLALPRTYGVDDLPLVLTSRRFHQNNNFSFEGDSDKYGDYLLANGTLDAQVTLPAQFIRLRILNAEIERGYVLGFSDNRTFHLIATDGGLVDQPIPVNRLKLMVGERVDLLVNLGDQKPGATIDLMAYNARQPFGFPGGEPGRSAPNGSLLNNLDFRLLHIKVGPPTPAPVTRLPETLTRNRFWSDAEVNNRRSLRITGGGPPEKEFSFGSKYFDMHTINQMVKLGAVEA